MEDLSLCSTEELTTELLRRFDYGGIILARIHANGITSDVFTHTIGNHHANLGLFAAWGVDNHPEKAAPSTSEGI